MMMTEEKESPKLSQVKQTLKRASFHAKKNEHGIWVIRFEALSRGILIQFVDYIGAKQKEFGSPLRLMLDFRGAGAPSRYMVERVPAAMSELLPPDSRIAYITDGNLESRFVHNAMQTWQVGEIEEFVNYDPAMRWLLE
jgi:hypothetical protein